MAKTNDETRKTTFEEMVKAYNRLLGDQGLAKAAPRCGKIQEGYYGSDVRNYFWYRLSDDSYRESEYSRPRALLLACYPLNSGNAGSFNEHIADKREFQERWDENKGISAHEMNLWKKADKIKSRGHEKCTAEIRDCLFDDYLITQYKKGKILYQTFFKGRAGDSTERYFYDLGKVLKFVGDADRAEYPPKKMDELSFENILQVEENHYYALILDRVAAIVLNKDVSNPIIARYTCTWGSALYSKGIHGRVFVRGVEKPEEMQTAQLLLRYIQIDHDDRS